MRIFPDAVISRWKRLTWSGSVFPRTEMGAPRTTKFEAGSCNTLRTLEITRRTSTIDSLMLRKISSMLMTISMNIDDDFIDVDDDFIDVVDDFIDVDDNFMNVDDDFIDVEDNFMNIDDDFIDVDDKIGVSGMTGVATQTV